MSYASSMSQMMMLKRMMSRDSYDGTREKDRSGGL